MSPERHLAAARRLNILRYGSSRDVDSASLRCLPSVLRSWDLRNLRPSASASFPPALQHLGFKVSSFGFRVRNFDEPSSEEGVEAGHSRLIQGFGASSLDTFKARNVDGEVLGFGVVCLIIAPFHFRLFS